MNVFITGASSGIGAALVRAYAQQGARIGAFARRPDALEALSRALPDACIETYAGDVSDAASVARAASAFLARFGSADIVIANAGVSRGADTAHAEDLPVFAQLFAVNVLGMVHTFHPFIAPMRERGRGRLVGVASLAGMRGLPGGGAYSASKAAAINYLESLRVELRGSGVHVVTIAPGYIRTPMTAQNPYRMPFLMDVDRAASLMLRAIDRNARWYVLPWPMAVVAQVLRFMPAALFDALFARAPRKPRAAT